MKKLNSVLKEFSYTRLLSIIFLGIITIFGCGGGGGGDGTVNPEPGDGDLIYNFNSLQNAVNNPPSNGIIEINSDIDFNNNTLEINNPVSLVGVGSPRSRFYDNTSTASNYILIEINHDDVTIQNLHIDGCDIAGESRFGIMMNGYNDLTVTNCDLDDWGHAAVSITDNGTAFITNNYIHHNDFSGLGYGVVVYRGSFAFINNNDFNHNRHDIAGDGHPDTGYEAFQNESTNSTGHAFDMHGWVRRSNNPHDHRAGSIILIYDNVFNNSSQIPIVIRGVPTDLCRIENNTFNHGWLVGDVGSYKRALLQRFETGAIVENEGYGNIRISNNTFNGTPPSFQTFQVQYNNNWNRLINTTTSLDNIAFGDFNGDGITDLFFSDGNEWKVSWSAYTTATHLNTSSYTINNLAFGDFNGDGVTDVFRTTGSQWQYSISGTSTWSYLNTSDYDISSLAFGDFDGDGSTDMFSTESGKWYYSRSGTSGWIYMNSSGVPFDQLYFVDINNNGTTDVCKRAGEGWEFCDGGKGSWQQTDNLLTWYEENDRRNAKWPENDFNGDGIKDNFKLGY